MGCSRGPTSSWSAPPPTWRKWGTQKEASVQNEGGAHVTLGTRELQQEEPSLGKGLEASLGEQTPVPTRGKDRDLLGNREKGLGCKLRGSLCVQGPGLGLLPELERSPPSLEEQDPEGREGKG